MEGVTDPDYNSVERRSSEDDATHAAFAALHPDRVADNAIHLAVSISGLFLCARWLRCACSALCRWD